MARDLMSGTVTFLFSDVESSTKLLEALGPAAYAAALADHRRLLRAAFAAHAGVEVDTQGDAFFVAFPTAPGAVAAAADAQAALAGGPIRVRMGIHTGTPLLTDEGYVGPDVHRAARIAAVGHGGQVLVSAATAGLLGAARLRDLGDHRLKDLSAPERIYQLGDTEFGPLGSLHQTNLPIPVTPFLGRATELAAVVGLLDRDGVRLLTLTGPGGSGKTRLAAQAGGQLSERYPAGVWWVPLAPVRDPGLVLDTAARVLGARNGLAAHVGERALLLLLDNFEQVVAAAPDVAVLLASCPNLAVLVTSREPLHVSGEHEYPVPPLAPHDAVELFIVRARMVSPDFEPDTAVAEICRRLDELPLAIELAAARVRALSTAQILARLEGRLALLTGGPRDLPARQRTLRAAIDWSHDLLDPDERRVFAGLAVFRGGCTLEAAERVAGADLDTLESLVDKSLLRYRDERFVMLETIREYAAERLEERGETEAARRRHADYFRESVTASCEPNGDNFSYGLKLDETDNLRAALEFLTEQPATDQALELAVALSRTWFGAGQLTEADEWLTRALARADPTETERYQWAVLIAGDFARQLGDWPRAERLKLLALEMGRRLHLTDAVATALFSLGSIARVQGNILVARERLDEALEIWQSAGMAIGVGHALIEFCELELQEDAPASAADYAREVLAIATAEGLTQAEDGGVTGLLRVTGLVRLAEALRRLGDLDQASDLLVEGLERAQVVHLIDCVRMGLESAAGICLVNGSADRAAVLLGAAGRLLKETGFVDDTARQRAPTEAAARASLGADADRARRLEGAAMTAREAIDFAVAGLRAAKPPPPTAPLAATTAGTGAR
jgi:predicted ATPase